MPAWRPRNLTVDQREERRLEAARLFRQGKLSQAEIARRMGVSPGAVSQWYSAWEAGGDEELKARPRTGRKARLNARQWEKLGHVLERGPMAAGFDSRRWTLQRVAALIEDRFGVAYHPRYLERPLRAHGFALREQERWAGTPSRATARARAAARRPARPGRSRPSETAYRARHAARAATGAAQRAPGRSQVSGAFLRESGRGRPSSGRGRGTTGGRGAMH